MPLEIVSGEEAFNRLGRTREARWPTKPRDAARMSPFARPECNPTFSIAPNSRVFTIGSCFARNIEKYLGRCGFDVPTLKMRDVEGVWHCTADNLLNKYTTQSMYNELLWALEPDRPFPDPLGYVEDKPDAWVDLQLPAGGTGADLELCRKRRQMIQQTNAEMRSCPTVIITLGLVEVWYDRATQFYLNRMPPKHAIEKEPSRFEFHVLNHRDILESLEQIHGLIRKHNPDANTLITVSPVPFVFTFRGMDALSANMYSKSALRAAVEEFVFGKEKIDYFPSYESVMFSERSAVWKEDRLHVTGKGIGAIMQKVLEAYAGVDVTQWEKRFGAIPAPAAELDAAARLEFEKRLELEDLASRASLAKDKRDWANCFQIAERLLILAQPKSPEWVRGNALAGVSAYYLKERPAARQHLDRAVEGDEKDVESLVLLGHVLLALKLNQEAVDRLLAASKVSSDARIFWLLGRSLLRSREADRAFEMFEASCAADPKFGWPRGEMARVLFATDPGRAKALAEEATTLMPYNKQLALFVSDILEG